MAQQTAGAPSCACLKTKSSVPFLVQITQAGNTSLLRASMNRQLLLCVSNRNTRRAGVPWADRVQAGKVYTLVRRSNCTCGMNTAPVVELFEIPSPIGNIWCGACHQPTVFHFLPFPEVWFIPLNDPDFKEEQRDAQTPREFQDRIPGKLASIP